MTSTALCGLGDWEKACFDRHNQLRALHGATPLQWDASCRQDAQQQANACAARRTLFHGNHDNQGQNAHMSNPPADGARSVDDWYSEINDYDFNSGQSKNGRMVGHFTQLVWAETTHVGVARSADGIWVIANYRPPGNWCGEEAANVGPPNGTPSAASKVCLVLSFLLPLRVSNRNLQTQGQTQGKTAGADK